MPSDPDPLAARHWTDLRRATRHLRYAVSSERQGHAEPSAPTPPLAWGPLVRCSLSYGAGAVRSYSAPRCHSELGRAASGRLGVNALAASDRGVLVRPGANPVNPRRVHRRALPLACDPYDFRIWGHCTRKRL